VGWVIDPVDPGVDEIAQGSVTTVGSVPVLGVEEADKDGEGPVTDRCPGPEGDQLPKVVDETIAVETIAIEVVVVEIVVVGGHVVVHRRSTSGTSITDHGTKRPRHR